MFAALEGFVMSSLFRFYAISIVLTVLISCHSRSVPEASRAPAPPVPATAEEKNVVLPPEELQVMTRREREKIRNYKWNRLDVSRKTPAASVYKDFSLPKNFSGSLVFEWLSHAGSKPGAPACNEEPLSDLRYTVIRPDGTQADFRQGQAVSFRRGDFLRVSVDTETLDCTAYWSWFTATVFE
jgi:hypothetical protein